MDNTYQGMYRTAPEEVIADSTNGKAGYEIFSNEGSTPSRPDLGTDVRGFVPQGEPRLQPPPPPPPPPPRQAPPPPSIPRADLQFAMPMPQQSYAPQRMVGDPCAYGLCGDKDAVSIGGQNAMYLSPSKSVIGAPNGAAMSQQAKREGMAEYFRDTLGIRYGTLAGMNTDFDNRAVQEAMYTPEAQQDYANLNGKYDAQTQAMLMRQGAIARNPRLAGAYLNSAVSAADQTNFADALYQANAAVAMGGSDYNRNNLLGLGGGARGTNPFMPMSDGKGGSFVATYQPDGSLLPIPLSNDTATNQNLLAVQLSRTAGAGAVSVFDTAAKKQAALETATRQLELLGVKSATTAATTDKNNAGRLAVAGVNNAAKQAITAQSIAQKTAVQIKRDAQKAKDAKDLKQTKPAK